MTEDASTIRAIVRALDGDKALVEVEHGGCGRCHEEGGCGGQQLTQMFCGAPKTYQVANQVGANIGDRVTIAVAAGSVRQTANLAYGVPLIAVILGALLGASLAGDLGAIVGAVAALVVAVFYVHSRSQVRSGILAERPYIVSRS